MNDFFPISQKIKFEGSKSTNHLSFKYYNSDEVILGKKADYEVKYSQIDSAPKDGESLYFIKYHMIYFFHLVQ